MDEVDSLGDLYTEAIRAQQRAFQTRDDREQNRWARRAEKLATRLVEHGAEGRKALEALLTDASRSVQLWAAARVLTWSPEKALPVLEDLLLRGERNRAGGLFGESIQVCMSAERILARHYGINVFDVLPTVKRKRGVTR